jgi:hypothetical protein
MPLADVRVLGAHRLQYPGRDPHDMDCVADHVGGALLAFGISGHNGLPPSQYNREAEQMAVEVSPGALGSAALSVALGILEKLVSKGVLSKQEVLDMLDALANAKDRKSSLYDSQDEEEAARLLAALRERLDRRMP